MMRSRKLSWMVLPTHAWSHLFANTYVNSNEYVILENGLTYEGYIKPVKLFAAISKVEFHPIAPVIVSEPSIIKSTLYTLYM